jgi:hypothetical protein
MCLKKNKFHRKFAAMAETAEQALPDSGKISTYLFGFLYYCTGYEEKTQRTTITSYI